MSELEKLPDNPVTLARDQIDYFGLDDFDMTSADIAKLEELDYQADACGFIGQNYFVEAGRALIIPASVKSEETVSYINFFGLALEGKFSSYSKVHIGRVIGANAVRAFCMTFREATLLPYFDKLESDSILHVPVLAVDTINRYE